MRVPRTVSGVVPKPIASWKATEMSLFATPWFAALMIVSIELAFVIVRIGSARSTPNVTGRPTVAIWPVVALRAEN